MIRKITLLVAIAVSLFAAVPAVASPVKLRCEYVQNPLGIDTPAPRLSWQNFSSLRNWHQTAYEIKVAASLASLHSATPDTWDSGKISSAESVNVSYAGPALAPRTRYFWSVKVWDNKGQASESTESSWWESGLLQASNWKSQWITWDNPDESADRAAMRWIWVAGQDAMNMQPKQMAEFETEVTVAAKPRAAVFFLIAKGSFKVSLNGIEIGAKREWGAFDRLDLAPLLKLGVNTVHVTVTVAEPNQFGPNAGAKTLKAALAGLIKITDAAGKLTRIPTSEAWTARMADGGAVQPANVVGDLNDARMANVPPLPKPAALLRKSFAIAKTVKSARIYATALGSYQLFVNGAKVSSDVLTPDFTDYSKRVLYQSYDVTALLKPGKNAVAAMLGDGWFGSPLTWTGTPFFFRTAPTRFMTQLEMTYSDGSHETIASDGSWKATASPVLRSEIYAGEYYDARNEKPGWSAATFNDGKWTNASVTDAAAPAVVSQVSDPVRIVKTVLPKTVSPAGKGAYVFDMGQNMVGWVRLKAMGKAGTTIRMRFAEILNPDGSIYTANLRNADATDTFVLRGTGAAETFTPHFTFHGFRYVEVTGYPGAPTPGSIVGEVASSVSGEATGKLETSSALVNKMWAIGLWGQRGNFLSIPTDCPQRDERLGWMGDAGVFWRTGTFNFDIAAFSHKFMNDVTDAQTEKGEFTNVSPDVLAPYGSQGAPGWGDAGVIVPWTAWMQYGDRSIVDENWDAMERWMKFLADSNPDYLRKNGVGPNFADWLAPDDRTPKDLLATAYWALIANMMADMAHATGRDAAATHYESVVNDIRTAYQAAYIKPSGDVLGGTQTANIVTLYTKLAPPALEQAMVDNLVKDIDSRGGHLSTGFLGTPFLLFTLAEHGRTDVAYKLLLNETYPSWGYMLSKGATTWWERWNGDTGDPSMNSYNHYAFGSVVAWVYRSVAGIDTSTTGTGYREIVIHPRPAPQMTHARGEYQSVYGTITTDWTSTTAGAFSMKVTIPANTSATIFLPAVAGSHVMQDGKPIAAERAGDSFVVKVGSGAYSFGVTTAK